MSRNPIQTEICFQSENSIQLATELCDCYLSKDTSYLQMEDRASRIGTAFSLLTTIKSIHSNAKIQDMRGF